MMKKDTAFLPKKAQRPTTANPSKTASDPNFPHVTEACLPASRSRQNHECPPATYASACFVTPNMNGLFTTRDRIAQYNPTKSDSPIIILLKGDFGRGYHKRIEYLSECEIQIFIKKIN